MINRVVVIFHFIVIGNPNSSLQRVESSLSRSNENTKINEKRTIFLLKKFSTNSERNSILLRFSVQFFLLISIRVDRISSIFSALLFGITLVILSCIINIFLDCILARSKKNDRQTLSFFG